MSLDPQLKAFAEVIRERKKNQGRQGGGIAHDDTHSVADWHDYIEYQINRTRTDDGSNARARFVKIAALALAAAESLGRKENP